MEYLLSIGVFVCIWGIAALSTNLLVGESGLVSVAQAAYIGLGAYATALCMHSLGGHFFFAAFLATIFTAIVAFGVNMVLVRLREVYYMFGTVAFNIILYSIFLNWQHVTNGPLGISGIARPAIFGQALTSNASFLLLVFLLLMLTLGVCTYIKHSSFGRTLRAIREDDMTIAIFGYNAASYKLGASLLSACIAAVAGALLASYVGYIDPSSFTINGSIFMLSVVILGGLGSSGGAILGASILTILPELLRFVGFPSEAAAQMRQLMYGLVLIFLMLYRPQGILGTFRI